MRLIGVDTPETNGGPICYGQEATGKAAELIGSVGGNVLLEKDISETDRYGRLLRYVWLEDAAGRRMLDEELVLAGYAQVSTFPPDVKYADRFLAAERNARAAKRGLWGACDYFGAPIAQPVPTSIVVPPPSGGSGGEPSGGLLYDPNGPDRDCSDFSTHQQAQDFFLAAGGPARDPHRLDGDHDGIACETLP